MSYIDDTYRFRDAMMMRDVEKIVELLPKVEGFETGIGFSELVPIEFRLTKMDLRGYKELIPTVKEIEPLRRYNDMQSLAQLTASNKDKGMRDNRLMDLLLVYNNGPDIDVHSYHHIEEVLRLPEFLAAVEAAREGEEAMKPLEDEVQRRENITDDETLYTFLESGKLEEWVITIANSELMYYWLYQCFNCYKPSLPRVGPLSHHVSQYVSLRDLAIQARKEPSLLTTLKVAVKNRQEEAIELATSSPSLFLELYRLGVLTETDLHLMMIEGIIRNPVMLTALMSDHPTTKLYRYLKELETHWAKDIYGLADSGRGLTSLIDLVEVSNQLTPWLLDPRAVFPIWNYNNGWNQLVKHWDLDRRGVYQRLAEILSAYVYDDTQVHPDVIADILNGGQVPQELVPYFLDNIIPGQRLEQLREMRGMM